MREMSRLVHGGCPARLHALEVARYDLRKHMRGIIAYARRCRTFDRRLKKLEEMVA